MRVSTNVVVILFALSIVTPTEVIAQAVATTSGSISETVEPGRANALASLKKEIDDRRLGPSLWRVTPSAVSEHVSELLGFPISGPSPLAAFVLN